MKCLVLKGETDPTDRQKLETIPFIGMLQRNPFSFKIGPFNAIRVELKGDGNSVHAEIWCQSPLIGHRLASAMILTKKD